jgi:hypothetical protein
LTQIKSPTQLSAYFPIKFEASSGFGGKIKLT